MAQWVAGRGSDCLSNGLTEMARAGGGRGEGGEGGGCTGLSSVVQWLQTVDLITRARATQPPATGPGLHSVLFQFNKMLACPTSSHTSI